MDGRLENFTPVALNVRCTFWDFLDKRISVEGEIYVVTAEVVVDPDVDIQRRDIVVARGRRYEVMTVFSGRSLRNAHKFNHAVLRESDA